MDNNAILSYAFDSQQDLLDTNMARHGSGSEAALVCKLIMSPFGAQLNNLSYICRDPDTHWVMFG
jgi:hypothetical protein